jgi:hypothetical protein
VNMHHISKDTSGFEPRLIHALNLVGLDSLLAEIGVTLLGEVSVQHTNSIWPEVGRTSEIMANGTFASIAIGITLLCFVFVLLSACQRSRRKSKIREQVEHIYLDDRNIIYDHTVLATDDVKGHALIVNEEGTLISDSTTKILKDLQNLESSTRIELEFSNGTCDVQSGLCEVCRQRLLKPSFFPVESQLKPPPRLPKGSTRKYQSQNCVAL